MLSKKSIYIYPTSLEFFKEGNNSYVKNLRLHVGNNFHVVNNITRIGLIDIFLNLHKIDILYFNWIEDVPDRKFGCFQVILLSILLRICKLFQIKIVWFIHNNVSHYKRNTFLKKWIIKMMKKRSDLIFSHSNELSLDIPKNKFYVFHHPIDFYKPTKKNKTPKYDLLIWSSVSPYKGIAEFVEFAANSVTIKKHKILIAGKFNSEKYFNYTNKIKGENVTIMNHLVPEEELIQLFADSNYILFTYNSASILSSAALCKSLAFGKEIIAPNVGSFKELGKQKLLYNYDSFHSLEILLDNLKESDSPGINKSKIKEYYEQTNWNTFSNFLTTRIKNLYQEQVA